MLNWKKFCSLAQFLVFNSSLQITPTDEKKKSAIIGSAHWKQLRKILQQILAMRSWSFKQPKFHFRRHSIQEFHFYIFVLYLGTFFPLKAFRNEKLSTTESFLLYHLPSSVFVLNERFHYASVFGTKRRIEGRGKENNVKHEPENGISFNYILEPKKA